jgi:hypothetical protein
MVTSFAGYFRESTHARNLNRSKLGDTTLLAAYPDKRAGRPTAAPAREANRYFFGALPMTRLKALLNALSEV